MARKPMTVEKAAKLVLEALERCEGDKLHCCDLPLFEAMRILAEHALSQSAPAQ
jgi:hypothetical protein